MLLGIFIIIFILYIGTGLVKNIIDIYKFFTDKDTEETKQKTRLVEKSERR